MTPIRLRPAGVRPHSVLAAALLFSSSAAFAAEAPSEEAAREEAAQEEAAVPDDRVLLPPALPGASDPGADCYQAARGAPGTGRMEQDAYVCDLAVQMARDASSAAPGVTGALAAALANRALVLARSGRLEPALADLDQALALAPDDARLYGNRGLLLVRLNRFEEALAAHDQAVSLAPQDPTVYYNRAFLYRALGEPALAAEDAAYARELLQLQAGSTAAGDSKVSLPDTAGPDARRAR